MAEPGAAADDDEHLDGQAGVLHHGLEAVGAGGLGSGESGHGRAAKGTVGKGTARAGRAWPTKKRNFTRSAPLSGRAGEQFRLRWAFRLLGRAFFHFADFDTSTADISLGGAARGPAGAGGGGLRVGQEHRFARLQQCGRAGQRLFPGSLEAAGGLEDKLYTAARAQRLQPDTAPVPDAGQRQREGQPGRHERHHQEGIDADSEPAGLGLDR